MLNDDKEWPLFPEFLLEAEALLAKSEECLNHLHLIKNDQDAIDCMLGTLLKLAQKADALALHSVCEFSRHIHSLLDQPQHPLDMNQSILCTLKDCFTLMAWQFELIDPVTGKLSLDDSEQVKLIETLAMQIETPTLHHHKSFEVVSIAKRNA